MLFYKVEGTAENICLEDNSTRTVSRRLAQRILSQTENFTQTSKRNAFCFVSDISENSVNLGVITDSGEDPEKLLPAYLKRTGLVLTDIRITEVTFEKMRKLLSFANRQGYIADDDEVLEAYDLDELRRGIGQGCHFTEDILEEKTKEDIFTVASENLMDGGFLPELERIWDAHSPTKFMGHPVHYIIQTDDDCLYEDVCQALLCALHMNRRLQSRRYCVLEIYGRSEIYSSRLDAFYRMCSGGAVVVECPESDDDEDSDAILAGGDIIEEICEAAKRYRNQVLTVLRLPRECKRLKSMIYEEMGGITLVELAEEFAYGQKAEDFLKTLARKKKVRTDKSLFAELDDRKGYLVPELRNIFDHWYDRKLKTTLYSQYRSLASADKKVIKAEPKGSAYDELQEMIGLADAKKVIQKALNYYKIQKLYREKDMPREDPAMHMVFTGNPGTAKTTVARLFARIMRDNELLSTGQIVEVGRGDLVGKYVGWTAPTVKAKFKAARGGVLFIDEAYSLVDDRDGSFGDEAINTIVQEMENRRDEVVVIFAGYPDKMEEFLRKNPGLRSRIAFHVPFADYDTDELCQITRLIGSKKGMRFTPEAEDKLIRAFDAARQQSDFGNGRYVRNLLEKAKMNLASRILETDLDAVTAEDLATIRDCDIEIPETTTTPVRRIGFELISA